MNNRKFVGGIFGLAVVFFLTFISFYRAGCNEEICETSCECNYSIPEQVYKTFCQKRSAKNELPIDLKFSDIVDQPNIVPVAVIGSGPAGLSAALYASRANIKTLVITGDQLGGQLMETTKIENWPGKRNASAPDMMEELRLQAASFGARFLRTAIERVDLSSWPYKLYTDSQKQINALSIIIATGASPKRLSIPGEQEFWGSGVASCAICDAPFFKNKKVFVIGGGNSAVEEASILASYAHQVVVLVRKDRMRATPIMQERLKKISNVSILFNREPLQIMGDENGVSQIKVLNNKTGEDEQYSTDAVFLAIGHTPSSALFSDFLKLTDQGYIKLIARTQQTSLPGVFAAGDVADEKYRQAGKAAGDGIAAALDAIEFLNSIGFSNEVSARLDHRTFGNLNEELDSAENIENQDSV